MTFLSTKFGTRIQRVSVANINDPSPELATYFALDEGSILIAYQADITESTIYNWILSPPLIWPGPQIVAGDGGYWIAISGKYSIMTPSEDVTIVTTTPYSVSIYEQNLYVDATVGDIVIELPPAIGSRRKLHTKKVVHLTNRVDLDADGTDLVDGNAIYSIYQLWEGVTVQDVAAGVWYVVK